MGINTGIRKDNDMKTLSEVVAKHLLVLIQYAGKHSNGITKFATVSLNNITKTAMSENKIY